jgi:hypothetical protein
MHDFGERALFVRPSVPSPRSTTTWAMLESTKENNMTHELFSVWKEIPAFVAKTPWKLQMPKGILSFKTKKRATAVATECKRIAALPVSEQGSLQRFTEFFEPFLQ